MYIFKSFVCKFFKNSLIPSFLVIDVSESLTKNERFAQDAHQKWANEPIAHFFVRLAHTVNSNFSQKKSDLLRIPMSEFPTLQRWSLTRDKLQKFSASTRCIRKQITIGQYFKSALPYCIKRTKIGFLFENNVPFSVFIQHFRLSLRYCRVSDGNITSHWCEMWDKRREIGYMRQEM